MSLAFFPPNGLDRSLHLPIFIGLLFVTFFTEAFGWTYAGLVVPGYLAATFMATPFTGLLIVVEACLAYLLTFIIGIWVPKTGAWSTTFGRERFFLFIVTAMLVRLGVEGYVVPAVLARYSLSHSRELYGIGLVLIPLTSNVFWNSGIRSAAPRLAFTTLLTYAVLEYGFARHTNFSLAHFLVANEAGEFDFIRSSKAQLILLIGAMIGARGNVLYGWDYNGILVPSLLGVAWYEPKKLLSTMVEAIVVFLIVRWLVSVRPFARMLIVGSRRMLLTFTVGFILKFALSFAALRYLPRLTMTDLFGFGYLLPSLLAVKMWNKGQMGVVLMPALQVSLTAFLTGNAVGYGLSLVSPAFRDTPLVTHLEESHTPPARLMLEGDIAPIVSDRNLPEIARLANGRALQILRAVDGANATSFEMESSLGHLRVLRSVEAPFDVVVPSPARPGTIGVGPRIALRRGPRSANAFLVVLRAPRPASPLFDVAHTLAEGIEAAGWMVVSRHEALAPFDESLAPRLADAIGANGQLDVVSGEKTELRVCGELPTHLPIAALRHSLRLDSLPITFVGCEVSSPVVLSLRDTDARAALSLRAEIAERWEGPVARALYERAEGLTFARTPTAPRLEDLRLFGAVFANVSTIRQPYEQSLATLLGYRFAEIVEEGEVRAIAAFEPPGPNRKGLPTLVVRTTGDSHLALEVPAPRWEAGTLSVATSLFEAFDARVLLLAGHLPSKEAVGDSRADFATYYQRAHESWLEQDGRALSIQGVAPEHTVEESLILSFGREIPDPAWEPTWAKPIRQSLSTFGLPIGSFDGKREHVTFSGSVDPAMIYADRFARDALGVLWLTQDTRLLFAQLDDQSPFGEALLERAKAQPITRVIQDALRCRSEKRCADSGCNLDEYETRFRSVALVRNPIELRAFVAEKGCRVSFGVGPVHKDPWVVLSGAKELRAFPASLRKTLTTTRLQRFEDAEKHVRLGIAPLSMELP